VRIEEDGSHGRSLSRRFDDIERKVDQALIHSIGRRLACRMT
jgi:hypothetical protein